MDMRFIYDISDFLFVEDKPKLSDAIMVVGGSFPETAEIAADLWKNGYAPYIFIGGGVSIKTGRFPSPKAKREIYSGNYETEYDLYMDVLIKNGVDKSAIIGENKSSYTKQNALFARKAADENSISIHRAILICKSFHSRRCLMLYQLYFPDVSFSVVTFDGFGITKENWYKTEYGINRVMGELKRCAEQVSSDEIQSLITTTPS